jgi:hypothetical protein
VAPRGSSSSWRKNVTAPIVPALIDVKQGATLASARRPAKNLHSSGVGLAPLPPTKTSWRRPADPGSPPTVGLQASPANEDAD